MKVDDEALDHLQALARVHVPEAEREAVQADLTHVLEAFGTLADVDVDGVEPLVRPVHLENVLRDDAVAPSLPRDRALSSGRARRDGFFEVPRMLDGD